MASTPERKRADGVKRAIAEGEARAQAWLARAPRCDVCGNQVGTPGRSRHFACVPDTIVGTACICAVDCSRTAWGNGPTVCDTRCVPCRVMHGQPLASKASNRSR